ncbi:hypothetical protein AB0L65_25990 [Nonomuraea sp. NPDC052116]
MSYGTMTSITKTMAVFGTSAALASGLLTRSAGPRKGRVRFE